MKLQILLILSAALAVAQTPAAVPMPQPEVQYLDAAGVPLSGSKLCTYAAATSTPLATYTDSTATTPNTNPVILDSYGRASIWVGPAVYKFVLRTGGDGTCSTGTVQWTQDNVGSWLYSLSPALALGSRLTVSVPGTLAIGTNLGPAAFYTAATTVKSVNAMVKTAPTGANLVMTVQQGSTVLFTCTIPSGSTTCTASSSPQTVPANTQIVVNITAVGTTFPGSDLTIQLN
jgi:hypothetical protein